MSSGDADGVGRQGRSNGHAVMFAAQQWTGKVAVLGYPGVAVVRESLEE